MTSVLPDDILIEIFDIYVDSDEDLGKHFEKQQRVMGWLTLVHVCRRWRSVVFQSPRRLNLRLGCTPKTPITDTLNIWPPLPLVVHVPCWNGSPGVDNIVAALEHNDRICQIQLERLLSLQWGYITNLASMQKPFPELTHLTLGTPHQDGPTLPDSFLSGTASRLQSLCLFSVSFPRLPNLLLSTTHLVHLYLHSIPGSGYIPPEVMATSLSSLTNLKFLHLHFRFSRLGTALLPPRPLTRSILPSLTKVRFTGLCRYLEEVLTRVDAPQLNELRIYFFDQTTFDTPQLFQLISRRPTLRAPEKGYIIFSTSFIIVKFPSRTSDYGALIVDIPCEAPKLRYLSSLEKVFTSSLPPLLTLEDLYIHEDPFLRPGRLDDVENTLWLQLLLPFVAVKNLFLEKEFVPRFVPALQELVGGRTTEVLPILENIFLEGFQPSGPLHEGIETFVAARRLTSHPVAVSRWDRDLERERHAWQGEARWIYDW